MSSRACDSCSMQGPMGPPGPQGPKGELGIKLPLIEDRTPNRGLCTVNGRGEFVLMPWRDVVSHLLTGLGLRPGDRLVIKRCDGTAEELTLDVLDEQATGEVHDT